MIAINFFLLILLTIKVAITRVYKVRISRSDKQEDQRRKRLRWFTKETADSECQQQEIKKQKIELTHSETPLSKSCIFEYTTLLSSPLQTMEPLPVKNRNKFKISSFMYM